MITYSEWLKIRESEIWEPKGAAIDTYNHPEGPFRKPSYIPPYRSKYDKLADADQEEKERKAQVDKATYDAELRKKFLAKRKQHE